MKLGKEIQDKHTYYAWNAEPKSSISNMAKVRKLDVISDKFDVHKPCILVICPSSPSSARYRPFTLFRCSA
jgi:hypothetical protein